MLGKAGNDMRNAVSEGFKITDLTEPRRAQAPFYNGHLAVSLWCPYKRDWYIYPSLRTKTQNTRIKIHIKVLKTSILAYTLLLVQGRT